jgi:putative ABC transport system permease protein
MLHFRFALRQLRKNPWFTLTAILTLSMGIGATTAIFSLVNAVLLEPLPFPRSDELGWIAYDDRALGGNGNETFSYPNFFDYRARQHSFTAIASYRSSGNTLIGPSEAQRINTQIVSADFFRVLGVAPFTGRDLSAADETPDARTAMLSWDLWQRVFRGDREIVGRSIDLDGKPYEVAGVLPAGFSFPIRTPPPDAWISIAEDADFLSQRGAAVLNLVGRLRPGVSLMAARADFQVIAGNLSAEYPKDNRQLTRIAIVPELDHVVGDTRPALRVLFAAVAGVLLIGCVNVAGLLLARGSRRKPEIALLAALGAGRGAILRQVLFESLLLSVAGGAVGVLLSSWGLEALRTLLPSSLPRFEHVSIDATVLIFATAVSVATGILFGVLPAWRTSRVEPLAAMRDSGRGAVGRQYRLQGWLVIAETAIGLVLLVGSGLLIRSFLRVLAVDPGFDARGVLTVNLSVPENRYPRDARLRLYDDLHSRLSRLPGVTSVAAAWPMPLSGNDVNIGFQIEGRALDPGAEPSEHMSVATPEFFRAMRIRLLAGREFTASDDSHSPAVVIVNEVFARKYFPGETAVGKRIEPGISDGAFKTRKREIVGVVASVKRAGLRDEADPQYYLPWAQAVITWPTLAIRSASDPASLARAVRASVAEVDRGIPVYRVATLESIVDKAAAEPRFQTLLFALFAAMAMFLSAVGLYAVLAYMVGERAAEIGVRMALGAQRGEVVRLVLRRALTLVLSGILVGLVASILLTRYMTQILFGIRPLDPLTLSAVSAILIVVSVLASLVPAYNAARLDPMEVLRKG